MLCVTTEKERAQNREKAAAWRARRRAENPERYLAENARRQREYNARNPDRVRAVNLKAKYGITLDDYAEILQAQDNVCGCCGGDFKLDKNKRGRHIDHDHATGRVRGIVCFKCNYILGRVDKDVEILKRAVAYLERVR